MVDISLFLLAFGGGIVSFLTPCNIVALPSFISYIGSQVNTVKRSIIMSLIFSLGFCVMFAIISTAFIFITGFIRYTFWLMIFSGIAIVTLAFYVFFFKQFLGSPQTCNIGNFNSPSNIGDPKPIEQEVTNNIGESPRFSKKIMKYQGYSGSFFLGFSVGFSWIGCITPIYFSIVIIVSNQADLGIGLLLFFIYALGIIIPFIIIGASIGKIKQRFLVKLIKFGSKLQKIFAVILLIIGIEIILSAFGNSGLIPFI